MKKLLAALAAVTLTAGLSLAAVVAPASAANTPTVKTTASSTPTPTPKPTTATKTAAAPVPASVVTNLATAGTTYLPADTSTTVYETIVWSMASGSAITSTDGSATYPQTGVTQYKNETTEDLDVPLPTTCGVSYQVDVYVQSFGTTDYTAALDALFAKGLTGPKNGTQDSGYLAGNGGNPGYNAWKYVTNPACLPCIPDTNVSYTYDKTTNSGVITIPSVTGHSDELCDPFYVTSASWTFDDEGNQWPQTIDQSNHVGTVVAGNNAPIRHVGSYNYGAPTTCGQGDTYASWTSNAATLFPESYSKYPGHLLGPSSPFTEHFLSDMNFKGTPNPSPTYMNTSTDCWKGTSETGVATSTTLACNLQTSNSLTLSSTTPGQPVPGGLWTVTGPGGYSKSYNGTFEGLATPSPLALGTYTIRLADASNTDAYSVTPYSTTWTVTNLTAPDCNTVVTPADPSVTQNTCNLATGSPTNTASLSVDVEEGITYSIAGPNGYSLSVPAGTTTFGSTVVGTALAPGLYTVTASAATGYELGASIVSPTWPFKITVANLNCSFGVTATAGDCPDTTATGFTAATTPVPSITVEYNPNVVYTATNTGTSATIVLTNTSGGSTTDVPDGTYTVAVTLSATGTSAGYVLPTTGTSFGPYDLTSFCPPTLATWNADATASDGLCTLTSSTDGVITLEHDADQTGHVNYVVVNDATHATVYSGTNTVAGNTLVNVGAGTYTVTATPLPNTDGLSGNGNVSGNSMSWPLSVAIDGADCDGSHLAFTGGVIGWFGFVLAGGMLFLGIAFLIVRRRGNRTAE